MFDINLDLLAPVMVLGGFIAFIVLLNYLPE